MNTFETLTDAFTEFERRADAAAGETGEPATRVPARHHSRAPLIAASVIATLAVAGGVTVLARNGGHGTQAGGATTAQPHQPLHRAATTASAGFAIPQTADELAARFRAVLGDLGDLATFTVTDTGTPVTVSVPPRVTVQGPNGQRQVVPAVAGSSTPNGAAIVGTLTSHGVTGGFDIQILQSTPGSNAVCDDPDSSRCTLSTTSDGGSLAVGREPLPTGGAGGLTYQVDLVRGDGVEFLMHVSNQRDPKGESAVLAPQPPLTTGQMVSIVTSDRW
jgi:hypothetical protein